MKDKRSRREPPGISAGGHLFYGLGSWPQCGPAPSSPPVDTDENILLSGLVCFSCQGEKSVNAFWFPFLIDMEGSFCLLKN